MQPFYAGFYSVKYTPSYYTEGATHDLHPYRQHEDISTVFFLQKEKKVKSASEL
jgi:hypothetical protein